MVRVSQLSAALLLLPQCCWTFLSSSSRSRSSLPFTHLQAATGITIDPSNVLSAPEPQMQVSSIDAPKVGVLLLNLGGPETGDDVEGT
jgi:hypothetical protein